MMSTRSDAGLPVISAIARDILRLGIGGRLPTTLSYQERFQIGSGTVQKALRELRGSGAVTVAPRGHQGTFITAMDLAQLWNHSGLPPVHILLAMPGALEPQAVAHALGRELDAIGATATIGFRAGAQARLDAIDNGAADVAVISSGAAEDLLPGDAHTDVDLGSGTYYQADSLVVVRRRDAPESAGRIGIDPTSDDHQRLTQAQFRHETDRFVNTEFTTIPRAILEGRIDTGVWHLVDSLIPLELAGLESHPLSATQARQLADEISSAVLLARRDTVVGAFLERLDVPTIREGCHAAMELGQRHLRDQTRLTVDISG